MAVAGGVGGGAGGRGKNGAEGQRAEEIQFPLQKWSGRPGLYVGGGGVRPDREGDGLERKSMKREEGSAMAINGVNL